MQVIISLTGTSLLSNKLLNYASRGEKYPTDFARCLDTTEFEKMPIGGADYHDVRKLISLIKPGAGEDLAKGFLPIPSNERDYGALCAETKSLELIIKHLYPDTNPAELYPKLKLYFISSNTPEGLACALALQNHYTSKGCKCVPVKETVIRSLTRNEGTFGQGLDELLRKVVGYISEEKASGNQVVVNATGGFKPESAYATVCGLFSEVDVYYAHENFEVTPARLPHVPLSINFVDWHLNAFLISMALAGSEDAYAKLQSRSKEISRLMRKTGAGYELDEFGRVLWDKYGAIIERSPGFTFRHLPGRLASDKVLALRTLRFMEKWEHQWEGMMLPQMVSHTRSHCHNLFRLADELLDTLSGKGNYFLEPVETYLLSTAIWLHDMGHNEHYLAGSKKEFLGLNRIRKLHADLTYQRIARISRDMGFRDDFVKDKEAQLIATICKAHRGPKLLCQMFEQLQDFEGAKIEVEPGLTYEVKRPVLVACLLSLLDSCDIGVTRAGSEKFRDSRTTATWEEAEAAIEHRASLPAGEKEYARVLDENIDFLATSEAHFNAHGKIALVRFEATQQRHDGKSIIDIVVHPTIKAKKERDFDTLALVNHNDYWHLGRDVTGFNKLFARCDCSFEFRLKEGDPMDEDDVALLGS